jgi:hypothetical protein
LTAGWDFSQSRDHWSRFILLVDAERIGEHN